MLSLDQAISMFERPAGYESQTWFQADNNQPGFNDLLEPFLRRLGQASGARGTPPLFRRAEIS